MQLHTKIVIGLLGGAAAGVAANALAGDAAWVDWVNRYLTGPVGQVFLRMLLMTVIPLVFASLALGVASVGDIRRVGKIGGKTLGYFVLSSGIAVVIGLTLVNVFQPGGGMDAATRQELLNTYQDQAVGLQAGGPVSFGIETFVAIVPRNPIQAAASMDMLGVICFSLLFGAALTLLPKERADPMMRFLEALGDVVIKIIDFAMSLAPYGVFGLIFVVTSQFGWGVLKQLSAYVAVVIGGLMIHAVFGISTLVVVFGRMNPVRFWKDSRDSAITAFSTSSSAATLPTNIRVAETEMGISPKIAGFVLPLGATMNMNGTALFEGVTVLFLAQVFGLDLTLGQQVVVIVLAVITAIGAAGVPGGSLPLLMLVLGAIGGPPAGIALIIGVDRILDMCRTTLNVVGDLSAAVYVGRSEGEIVEAPAQAA